MRFCIIPGKSNVVMDALSRKTKSSVVGSLCMRISIDSPLLEYCFSENLGLAVYQIPRLFMLRRYHNFFLQLASETYLGWL